MTLWQEIYNLGIVPLIGKVSPAESGDLARALAQGGLTAAAITLDGEKDVQQARAMAGAVSGFKVFAYAVNDAESARRAVEAGVCGVFTQSADEAVLQPLAQAGVECLPVPSVVKFAKLADYFSCGRVAACLCPDLETKELLGKSYFDAVVRRTRQAVSAMLGFDLRHVGINQPDAESSARTAGEFESLFGFTRTDRGGAYFAGEVVEVMKKKFYGEHGHIAVATNDAGRAAYFLQKQGAVFNWQSAGYEPDGSLRVVYLAKEIGGFAVHILQRP